MAKRKAKRQTDDTGGVLARTASVLASLQTGGVGGVALLVVGIGLAAWAIIFAERRADDLLGAEAGRVRIAWADVVTGGQRAVWPPTMVQAALDAEAQSLLAREGGPLSVGVLASLGGWLESTGWVERVRRIERSDGGVIQVAVDWRAPAAAVRQHGGRDHLVSADGRRLPMSWPGGTSPFPVILGARQEPQADRIDPGEPWPDPSVQAGVELLMLLHDELGSNPEIGSRGIDQIRGIDVIRYSTLGQLTIVTDRDSRVRWGRAPSDPVQDVVSVPEKLSRLAHLRAHPEYGRRIDAGLPFLDLSSGRILVDRGGLDRSDVGADDPQP
ncbi:MAG: hypothetical protein AAGB48_02705 [Planctomycetota bacterium]